MKNNILESFPILSSNEKKKIADKYFNLEIQPMTTINNEEKNIIFEIDNNNKNIYYLKPDETEWSCKTNDLKLQIKVKFSDVKVFYDEFNLTNKESVLGLGVKVICKNSRFHKYIKFNSMTYHDDTYCDEKNILVNEKNKRNLTREVKLEFFIYLEKSNNPEDNMHAKIKGTNFGEIKEVDLILEGDDPEFNINEVEEKDKPFIYFDIDWTDLNDEFFSMCKIYINKSSKYHDKIDLKESNDSSDYIWIETFTNFFTEILFRANCDYDENEDYDIGSVGHFVRRYIKDMDLTKETIEDRMRLYEVIKYNIEKRIVK